MQTPKRKHKNTFGFVFAVSVVRPEKVDGHCSDNGGSQEHDPTTTTDSFKMAATYKFENEWVISTVEVQADSSLKEIAGYRLPTSADRTSYGGPGTVSPTINDWVSAMVAETEKLASWYAGRHTHKLSYKHPEKDKCSSVVWVPSKNHYMEVRRGEKTVFTAAERQTWASLTDWCVGACGGRMSVPEVKKEAAVAEVPAVAPVVEATFNPEKFKKDFDGLIAWARDKSAQTKAAAIVQICHWLLEMKARSAVAMWLEETPVWHVSIRAIVQAREWEWTTPASAAAVAAFLEKF